MISIRYMMWSSTCCFQQYGLNNRHDRNISQYKCKPCKESLKDQRLEEVDINILGNMVKTAEVNAKVK